VALFSGEGDVGFSRQPIIGWRVDAFRPRPVVVDDWFEGANDYKTAIKYPDGQVVMPFDDHYRDETAWRTARRKKQQKPG
jgi:secreted PhoX family phosphatase